MHRHNIPIPFTNCLGELDYLPWSDLEAAQRSGSSSWQDYASTPSQWPEITTPIVPLIDARPGQVEPEQVIVDGLNSGDIIVDDDGRMLRRVTYLCNW